MGRTSVPIAQSDSKGSITHLAPRDINVADSFLQLVVKAGAEWPQEMDFGS